MGDVPSFLAVDPASSTDPTTLGSDFYTGILSPDVQPIGLPTDSQSTAPPPGFESTVGSVSSPPPISTIDKIWGTIKSDASAAVGFTESEIKAGYQTTKSAVGTVVGDVANPLANTAKSIFWYAIVAVVVIAGGIYFIGRGGAVKVNAIV
jgi:hypothetical protein